MDIRSLIMGYLASQLNRGVPGQGNVGMGSDFAEISRAMNDSLKARMAETSVITDLAKRGGAVVAMLGGMSKALEAVTDQQLANIKEMSKYNAAIAHAQLGLETGRIQRSHVLADQMSKSSQEVVNMQNQREQFAMPYVAIREEFKNAMAKGYMYIENRSMRFFEKITGLAEEFDAARDRARRQAEMLETVGQRLIGGLASGDLAKRRRTRQRPEVDVQPPDGNLTDALEEFRRRRRG